MNNLTNYTPQTSLSNRHLLKICLTIKNSSKHLYTATPVQRNVGGVNSKCMKLSFWWFLYEIIYILYIILYILYLIIYKI